MSFSLFQLVPAIYRLRDGQIAATMPLLSPTEQSQLASLQTSTPPLTAEQQAQLASLTAKSTRGPLESLLMVIDEQLSYFAADLDQLYDNQFIETCAPWVIPYIGDLIGYQQIHGIAPSVDDPRSEVANTIAMRRRKGTVLVLEQLARDVTGWGAHAVEFFLELACTQYVKCVRLHNYATPDVRGWQPRAFRDSGFSRMTRRIDVRNPASPGLPRYNLPNIGIYLWSLQAFSTTAVTLTPVKPDTQPNCYRFSLLGCDMPLSHAAVYQGEQIAAAATEANVPDFLTRHELCADLRKGASTSYYGNGASLSLTLNGEMLNPYQIQVANLSGADGSWNNIPTGSGPYVAAIDPELGRIALVPPPGGINTFEVSYYYGFNGAMGGGEYEREDGFVVTELNAVFPFPDAAASYTNDLQKAVQYVAAQTATLGKVALEFSSSGEIDAPTGPLEIHVPEGATVEIRAGNGARPLLLLDGEIRATGEANSTLILNGLLIAAAAPMAPGAPHSTALIVLPEKRPGGKNNELATLQLTHTTLVPGWALKPSGEPVEKDAAVLVAKTQSGQIAVQSSILGPIHAPELVTVNLADSILDATAADGVAYAALDGHSGGGPLTLTGCTVVGNVHAQELALVSDSIVWAEAAAGWPSGLYADRAQAGCVRFSFIPVNAITPRRFKCVERALAGPAPVFFSFRYGHPGYLKMLASTDPAVREGADDGGEMGAFHFLLAPLRERDLEIRLEEYTPVGLNPALIYQT
jgi:hypothetical protein